MTLSKSYLAGLFDGEGCIFIGTRSKTWWYTLRCSICMTHRPMIDMLCEQFNSTTTIHKIDLRKPNCRRAYEFVLTTNRARDFLELIYDDLIIKKEEARIALLFQAHLNRYRGMLPHLSREEIEPYKHWRENARLLLQAHKKGWFLGASDWNGGEFGGHPMPGLISEIQKGNTELSKG